MTQDETFEFQGKRWRKTDGPVKATEEWFTAIEVKPTKPDPLEKLDKSVKEIYGSAASELGTLRQIAHATVQAALEMMREGLKYPGTITEIQNQFNILKARIVDLEDLHSCELSKLRRARE